MAFSNFHYFITVLSIDILRKETVLGVTKGILKKIPLCPEEIGSRAVFEVLTKSRLMIYQELFFLTISCFVNGMMFIRQR